MFHKFCDEEPVRASLEEVPELDEYTTDFDSSSDHTVQEESIAQDVRTGACCRSFEVTWYMHHIVK